MTDSVIQYDTMVQNALLSVVRNVLKDTAEKGLPGDHHFYLTFDTTHPETVIPPYLNERYPEEMTIVVQNQYSDLLVTGEFFEISLSFNGKREKLHVPFPALQGFFDPSVDFGLHFHVSEEEDDDDITELTSLIEQEDNDIDPSANVVTLDQFRKK